jgi:hypothetical protein
VNKDEAHLARVRALPCLIGFGCEGRVEADHVGYRGVGEKSSDHETIPLCTRHHRERHLKAGYFLGFTKTEMREWREDAIVRVQSQLFARCS